MTLLERFLRGAAAAGGIALHLRLLTAVERSRHSPCSETGRQRTWALIRQRLAEMRRELVIERARELVVERVERRQRLQAMLDHQRIEVATPAKAPMPASWPAAPRAP